MNPKRIWIDPMIAHLVPSDPNWNPETSSDDWDDMEIDNFMFSQGYSAVPSMGDSPLYEWSVGCRRGYGHRWISLW